MFRKWHLFTPGPVPVAPQVLLAGAVPTPHHRLPEFSALLSEIRRDLQYLFQTQRPVFFFASSGTGAMEAAVANLFSPGEKVLVIRGGKFGERWGEIAEGYGLSPVYLDVEWGKAVQAEEVKSRLDRDPEIRAVLVQAHETSTGVKHPVEELAALCRDKNVLLVVDAISALGVYPLPMDEWGIDVMVAGSQKSLALPPGLSFLAVSERAWSRVEKASAPRYYFDLRREWKAYQKETTAYTPAVSLLLSLHAALRLVRETGLEKLFAHYALVSEATRRAVRAMGLEVFPEVPCEALTVIRLPEEVDGGKLTRLLRERYGVVVAGGQGKLKGRVVRITHMGHQSPLEVVLALAALGLGLSEMGFPVKMEEGLAQALAFIGERGKEVYA
ncbi:alanine--glyoxylate aminotransferase family protein [Thermosulfurimonas sp.]|uniref:pyridoxal-phosphate-dependent aminotransferase family protein n=1 Tax=Thermosulfurimonas sp. TaxID=2080236 RepID=UPI0025EE2900|nr:alanine--glyoxylate aminotransferase family protein [Thermosulfurimonas sp.]